MSKAKTFKRKVQKASVPSGNFAVDVTGGDGYRKLRESEEEVLKESLSRFSEEATRISQQEIDFKKDLVKWLVKQFEGEMKGYWYRSFNAGSAYEKVQAGEAKDFDVMIFLNIRKWLWQVHDDPSKPGFCWLTRGKERRKDNPMSFAHFLDEEGRLSSLKVRRFFTSKIDKFLRRNNPLEFEHAPITPKEADKTKEGSESVEKVKFKVEVTRKCQGPATTLNVECKGITPFTIDLVNSLHQHHIRHDGARCDYVAKPFDKQTIFGSEYAHLWRRSYSRQETNKLKDIDDGNQIHKKLLRIFKMLRNNQSQLKLLKSYVFKNLIFYMSDMKGRDWGNDQIADRFIDMVLGLRNCLANHRLPVYFNQQINLLSESEYGAEKLEHIRGYLKRVANKGVQGYESLLTVRAAPPPPKRKIPSDAADTEILAIESPETGQSMKAKRHRKTKAISASPSNQSENGKTKQTSYQNSKQKQTDQKSTRSDSKMPNWNKNKSFPKRNTDTAVNRPMKGKQKTWPKKPATSTNSVKRNNQVRNVKPSEIKRKTTVGFEKKNLKSASAPSRSWADVVKRKDYKPTTSNFYDFDEMDDDYAMQDDLQDDYQDDFQNDFQDEYVDPTEYDDNDDDENNYAADAYMDEIDYMDHADEENHADTADLAEYGEYDDPADLADLADYDDPADLANLADPIDLADYADLAEHADYDDPYDLADYDNPYDPADLADFADPTDYDDYTGDNDYDYDYDF
ncbi:uncharacterized protein [Watersipora subatra]|uniref:uncharacterized protein n=1 Tax=Watersipora subatra TaxID=2589382 RepID=UPI00355AF02A